MLHPFHPGDFPKLCRYDIEREGPAFLNIWRAKASYSGDGHEQRILAMLEGMYVIHQRLRRLEHVLHHGDVDKLKSSDLRIPQEIFFVRRVKNPLQADKVFEAINLTDRIIDRVLFCGDLQRLEKWNIPCP